MLLLCVPSKKQQQPRKLLKQQESQGRINTPSPWVYQWMSLSQLLYHHCHYPSMFVYLWNNGWMFFFCRLENEKVMKAVQYQVCCLCWGVIVVWFWGDIGSSQVYDCLGHCMLYGLGRSTHIGWISVPIKGFSMVFDSRIPSGIFIGEVSN